MQKPKPLLFFSKNIILNLSLKFLFFFSIGVYILTLPIYTLKFSLVDGINIYGFISPNWILLIENIFCIILSFISFVKSYLIIKEVYGVMINDKKQ